jgi:Fe2+ or Zn2+ uptake regulation protein
MNLEKILQEKKKNVTPERKMLFEKMKHFHLFSARDISESFPDIPRASIFRSIKLFTKI